MNLTVPVFQLTGDEIPANQLAQPDKRYLYHPGLTAEKLQSGFLQAEKRLGPCIPEIVRERMAVSRQLGAYAWFCWEFNTVSMFWSLSNIELALRTKYNETQPDNKIVVSKKTKNGWKKKGIATCETLDYYEQGWGLRGKADSEYEFARLLNWAFENSILPRQIPVRLELLRTSYDNNFRCSLPQLAVDRGWVPSNPTENEIYEAWQNLPLAEQKKTYGDSATILIRELPRLRNLLAHPSQMNQLTVGPSGAIESYELLVEIVSRLWPAANDN